MSLGAMIPQSADAAAKDSRKGASGKEKLVDSSNKLLSKRVKTASPGKKRPKSPPKQRSTEEKLPVRPAGAVIYQEIDPEWLELSSESQQPTRLHRARHSDRDPALQKGVLRCSSFKKSSGARAMSPANRAAQRIYETAYQTPFTPPSPTKRAVAPSSQWQESSESSNSANNAPLHSKTPVSSKKKSAPKIYARADSAPCLTLGMDSVGKDETEGAEDDELLLFDNRQRKSVTLPVELQECSENFVTPPKKHGVKKIHPKEVRRFSSSSVEIDSLNHLTLVKEPSSGRGAPLQRGIEVHHSDASADSGVIGLLLASVTSTAKLLDSVDAARLETHAEEQEDEEAFLVTSPPRRAHRSQRGETVIVNDMLVESTKEWLLDVSVDVVENPKCASPKHVVKSSTSRKIMAESKEADGVGDTAPESEKKKTACKIESLAISEESKRRKDDKKINKEKLSSPESELPPGSSASEKERDKSPKRHRNPPVPFKRGKDRSISPQRKMSSEVPNSPQRKRSSETPDALKEKPISPQRKRTSENPGAVNEKFNSPQRKRSSENPDAVVSKVGKTPKAERSKSDRRLVLSGSEEKASPSQKPVRDAQQQPVNASELRCSLLDIHAESDAGNIIEPTKSPNPAAQGAKQKKARNHSMGSIHTFEEAGICTASPIMTSPIMLKRRKSGPPSSSFSAAFEAGSNILSDGPKCEKATKDVQKTTGKGHPTTSVPPLDNNAQQPAATSTLPVWAKETRP